MRHRALFARTAPITETVASTAVAATAVAAAVASTVASTVAAAALVATAICNGDGDAGVRLEPFGADCFAA